MRYGQGMISDDLVFKSLSPNAPIKIPTHAPPQNFEIQIMFRVIVFNFDKRFNQHSICFYDNKERTYRSAVFNTAVYKHHLLQYRTWNSQLKWKIHMSSYRVGLHMTAIILIIRSPQWGPNMSKYVQIGPKIVLESCDYDFWANIAETNSRWMQSYLVTTEKDCNHIGSPLLSRLQSYLVLIVTVIAIFSQKWTLLYLFFWKLNLSILFFFNLELV